MPTHGVLRLTYCSGDGTKKDGFDVSVECRRALTYLTTIKEELLMTLADRLQLAQLLNSQMIEAVEEPLTPSSIYNTFKRMKPETSKEVPVPILPADESTSNTANNTDKSKNADSILPGLKFIEKKLDLFKKYLSVNDVKAAIEFAHSGKGKEAADTNKKTDKKKKK